MNVIEPSFDATTFTKNRERLLRHGVGQALFGEVVLEADRHGLLSDEHFTVDGTLIEAAASLKSFKSKEGDPPRTTDADPGNPSVDFHGERRGNATHQSTTDPEARLLRKGKGKEARLAFMVHALMENRHGMLVDFQTTQATGTAERDMTPSGCQQLLNAGELQALDVEPPVDLVRPRAQRFLAGSLRLSRAGTADAGQPAELVLGGGRTLLNHAGLLGRRQVLPDRIPGQASPRCYVALAVPSLPAPYDFCDFQSEHLPVRHHHSSLRSVAMVADKAPKGGLMTLVNLLMVYDSLV